MRVGDYRHIQTVSDYLGLSELHGLGGDFSVHGVQKLVLEEQNRVIVPDRCPQQMVCIGGVGRGNYLQAGAVHEQGLRALCVLGSVSGSAAFGKTHGDGAAELSAAHEVCLCRMVDYRIEDEGVEVGIHNLDYRPEAHHGSTYGHAGKSFLRYRGVDDLVRMLLPQTLGNLEAAAVDAYILTEENNIPVSGHLVRHCLSDCLAERHDLSSLVA